MVTQQLNLIGEENTAPKQDTASLLLNALIGDSLKKVTEEAQQTVLETKQYVVEEIERIKKTVNDNLKTFDTDTPLVINIGTIEKPKKKSVHKAFAKITKILSSAKRKEKNVMIVGAAGGGKTHLVSTIADAMKLPFYPMSVGLQTTKSDLLGFINATGGYVTSPVREAYEKGGVLLLDEFDATHAGVITILNSLLANGHCSFPDKIVTKHENFVCICACNTYGKGGNLDYVGRNRLDAATLDRFIVVDVDYDSKLERKLTNNDVWLEIIKKVRNNAKRHGIKCIISPRASMDGADLIDGGFTMKEALEMTVFKGCDKDIETKLLEGVDLKAEPISEPSEPQGLLTKLPVVSCTINFDTLETNLDSFKEYVPEEALRENYGRCYELFKIGKYKFNLYENHDNKCTANTYSPYIDIYNEVYLNQGIGTIEDNKDMTREMFQDFRDELKCGHRIDTDFNFSITLINNGIIEKFLILSEKEGD